MSEPPGVRPRPVRPLPLVGRCSPGLRRRRPILANPPRRDRPSPSPTPAAARRRRPAARRPAARRRPARPADRVVVLHRPPACRRTGGGSASSSSSSAPSAARSPSSWASHLAITDEQRRPVPVRPAARDRPAGRPIAARRRRLADRLRPRAHRRRIRRRGATAGDPPWTMAGVGGTRPARRGAVAGRGGRGQGGSFGLGLDLAAGRAAGPPRRRRLVDFGPAGGSYYYSRTAHGGRRARCTLDGETLAVTGEAWFDHQWGDFISVGGGGWDWFAVNLDDGTDLTLSLVRDADGALPARLRHARRARRHGRSISTRDASTVDGDRPLDESRRPARPTRPAGAFAIPGEALDIDARPDGRRPGARHAGDDRRRLLGGIAARVGDAGRAAARRRGLRRAHRLRAVARGATRSVGRGPALIPGHDHPAARAVGRAWPAASGVRRSSGAFGRAARYSADATGADATRRLRGPGDDRAGDGPRRRLAQRAAHQRVDADPGTVPAAGHDAT